MNNGDRIYYTGDMANAPGWFVVLAANGNQVVLEEIIDDEPNPRSMTITRAMIGNKYEGHCGTRFVTKAAYDAFLEARRREYQAQIDRMSASRATA